MNRYSNLNHSDLERMLSEAERLLRAEKDTDTDYLLQNLQLHKIELEIQNRDLMESQKELENVRDQYAELYDFAPVGYLTLDKNGIIKNLNLTAAGMFGAERSQILGKPLSSQLGPGMGRLLFDHLRQAFSSDQKVTADLALKTTSDGIGRYVRADTIVHADVENQAYCLMNLIDTTERRRAEQAVINERTFLQHVIDGVDNPIMVISLDYKVLRMNEAAKRNALIQKIDPEHACCYQVSHQVNRPCDSDDYPCPLKIVLQTRLPSKVVHNHISEFGTQRKYEVSVSPLFDDNGEIMGVIESAHDITEHLELLDELKERQLSYAHLAQHDALTGLPNRLLFADRLSQAIHVAHRNKSMIAILFIDLDRFKEVNDSFNHATGDAVLKEVAVRFQSLFREDDTIARMGGDEFTVILTHIKRDSNAALVAKKLLNIFKKPFTIQNHKLYLSASIGISLYPDHGNSVDELVRNADTAMYRAKEEGRNTFQYYTLELTAKAFERVFLASSLHNAISQNELILYYQPQFELITQEICGVEALVRWQNRDLGLLSPDKFIPLAEESEVIDEMGAWIMKEACQQMKTWQESGVLRSDMTISVNLSGKQFDHTNLLEEIEQTLTVTGLSPSCLELEITETTMMRSTRVTSETLRKLRKLDIKVAIDDFGTGYSSLNYLKQLPITRLKIDKTFVSDIPNDLNDVAISKAIIAMANNLLLDVLAEGIETGEQQQFLIQQGCRVGQGYLFARPMSSDQFETFVEQKLQD
ncbi:MAG: EAL domain-containing protein [Candidatus Thiodiazotropha taylori]|nr:EAL domain-containing protein [Candidatus Thiodiazotropha taylori]